MPDPLDIITMAVGVLLFLLFLFAAVASLGENARRAARRAFVAGVLFSLPFLLAGLRDFAGQAIVAGVLLAVTLALVLVLAVPTGKRSLPGDETPVGRIDERDIMFSRWRLHEGTERFERYYRDNPDKKAPDDKFRAQPGLLEKTARLYEPLTFSAARGSFDTVERFRPFADGEVSKDPADTDPRGVTRFIKTWAKKSGAVSVGVTELRDYHLYSTVGRGDDYGQAVDLDHRFAIAFTVEMDKAMVDCAPQGPTVMESAEQYLRAGTIAVQIAAFIRRLGYPARAHIDANYRVVCPLVARDAGLGEIGRMGLLMTPELGPRVRIAVVTTDLPLVIDARDYDGTVIDFCVRCKKCAEACPPKAIPFGDRGNIDGVARWQIDQEACFTYWCGVGTDCARCVSVCPYSHPDTLLHNIIRRGIRNSSVFRRLAVKLDNTFYGRIPPASPPPDWTRGLVKGGRNG